MTANTPLSVGEPAPWFSAADGLNRSGGVLLDEMAGQSVVLFFFGAAVRQDVRDVLARFWDLDGNRYSFVGVSNDVSDFTEKRVREPAAGRRILLDLGDVVARQYLSGPIAPAGSAGVPPMAFVLTPALQIAGIIELADPAVFVESVLAALDKQSETSPAAANAPVLVVPRVFDPQFCDQLIELYNKAGGREIGAIEQGGKAVEQFDTKFRKRLDFYIEDPTTVSQTRALLERRLLPMVYRAFQFRTTRIERYLVGCYEAESGGYFRPHRDNTAPVVAHRRFALTINLNSDYEGGDLRFPEFGHRSFKAQPGDAIVFSCSLLHEVTPVVTSRRYAFVSFFYDEESQRVRDEYLKRWQDGKKPGNA